VGTVMASDEVTDDIAHVEMQRQDMEKEAGLAAACTMSLRKLQEILQREQQVLLVNPGSPEQAANVEAVSVEIERVKGLAGLKHRGQSSKKAQARQPRRPWRNNAPQDASQKPHKPRGRRNMRRRGR
jgi:hypothetical protein